MSCCKARHLSLSMPLSDQGCKWYWPICEGNLTIAVGHLQWTGIPSKKSSNTPGHFCHRNWSRAPVLTIHLASLVPWEWNRLLCPVASDYITGVFSFLATTTGGGFGFLYETDLSPFKSSTVHCIYCRTFK